MYAGAMTQARSVLRLTEAVTPSSLFSLACTRAAQAAQVIPPMTSSTSAVPGTAPASGLAAAISITSRPARARRTPAPAGAGARPRATMRPVETRSISVTGMSCDHCARAVQAEVGKLPGIADVDVDVTAGRVRITAEPLPDDAALREAIEEAGYEFAG